MRATIRFGGLPKKSGFELKRIWSDEERVRAWVGESMASIEIH